MKKVYTCKDYLLIYDILLFELFIFKWQDILYLLFLKYIN